MQTKLKILCLDIENFPCLVYSWELGEVNIPLEFLVRDWTISAWAAKWVGDDKVMYMDNRGRRDVYDDKRLVKGIIKLINEADVIIGQNVKRFDLRKIAARADFHKLKPFRPCKIIDILKEERRVFALTSHKLAYKTERNSKYKKLKHEKFPGFDLWKGCMANQLSAWKEKERYCIHDVLSTEERYNDVKSWIKIPTIGPVDGRDRCRCGSTNLKPDRYLWTDAGRFRLYHCLDCGKWPRSAKNLLTKEQKSGKLREAQ